MGDDKLIKKVIILQAEKDRLLATIKEKETLLFQTTKQANSWNPGKNRSAGNTQSSKIYVQSLKKEIKGLHAELAEVNKSST